MIVKKVERLPLEVGHLFAGLKRVIACDPVDPVALGDETVRVQLMDNEPGQQAGHGKSEGQTQNDGCRINFIFSEIADGED